MSFAIIPMKFSVMEPAYRDNKSLPSDISNWLRDQNAKEEIFNANLPALNATRASQGLVALKKQHSTSCCMQASLSFNAAGNPIPKRGARDRDNTTLDAGKNYILTVEEFRAYLTYRYGATDQVSDWSQIQGMLGVLIFSDAHIELWDGVGSLQSAERLAAYGRNVNAKMAPGFLETRPQYFWECTGDSPTIHAAIIPKWLTGWWTVYDTNYYYYYFFDDGTVIYIQQKPSAHWIPPKTVGNRGVVVKDDQVHGYKVTWGLLPGETSPTIERFTPLGWTSQTEMNATSNKYAMIYARKIEVI